ncbi:unnamed protein product [Caenorhabditis sp. 36 PRJEB53466]|nr:unnamed protein product [Caenorhabditis sp. 36 PRJEB53466]
MADGMHPAALSYFTARFDRIEEKIESVEQFVLELRQLCAGMTGDAYFSSSGVSSGERSKSISPDNKRVVVSLSSREVSVSPSESIAERENSLENEVLGKEVDDDSTDEISHDLAVVQGRKKQQEYADRGNWFADEDVTAKTSSGGPDQSEKPSGEGGSGETQTPSAEDPQGSEGGAEEEQKMETDTSTSQNRPSQGQYLTFSPPPVKRRSFEAGAVPASSQPGIYAVVDGMAVIPPSAAEPRAQPQAEEEEERSPEEYYAELEQLSRLLGNVNIEEHIPSAPDADHPLEQQPPRGPEEAQN